MLENPVNPDMPYMRGGMVYWLLPYISKNSKFFDEFKIFDIGKVWNKTGITDGKPTKFASSFVNERTSLGLMLYTKDVSSWHKDPLLAAKEMVKIILKNIGIETECSWEKSESTNFHPKKQAYIVLGNDARDEKIWFIGSLHPFVLKDRKIAENAWVVYVTLDIDKIVNFLKEAGERHYHYETLQDQIIYRDLCFVVDTDKEFGWVLEAVKKVPEVKDIEVFDIYAWTNLGEGKKSLAFKMKLIGDGNMTTEQINEIMNKAIKAGEAAGGKLRS